MKRFIYVALVLALIIAFWATLPTQTRYTGYVYRNTGLTYDNGLTRGTNWVMTGETYSCSMDELKELGKTHTVRLTGLLGGVQGLIFELASDQVLMVPGLGLDSGVSESYGFF